MGQNGENSNLDDRGRDGNAKNLAVCGTSSEENASTFRESVDWISQDDEGHHKKVIGEPLSQFEQRSEGNSSNSVDRNDLEDVVPNNSEGNSSLRDKEVDLGTKSNEFGLAESSIGAKEGVIDRKMLCARGIQETSDEVEESTSGSLNNNYVCTSVGETVILINTEESASASLGRENRMVEMRGKGLGSNKALTEKQNKKLAEAGESCVIDVKAHAGSRRGLKQSWSGEKVCRICHLTSDQSQEFDDGNSATATATAIVDLIHLGCGCKDELGIAHRHCAEAWFKLKGNRTCEICGAAAENVTGVGDQRFIEGWNEQGLTSGNGSSSERAEACWRGQPFCNFLMACLVISFVLPWFFRVNMF